MYEQVHLEMPPVPEGEKPAVAPDDPFIAFQHYGQLYVKYMQIIKKLEECYDCMVHPQKRIDIVRIWKITMTTVHTICITYMYLNWTKYSHLYYYQMLYITVNVRRNNPNLN